MSEQNYYETLGVDENATFEEIQEVRVRLVKEFSHDRKRIEAIEAAYDAILMERLRLRQEGKIKVPDRIRFPERQVPEVLPDLNAAPQKQTPAWLDRFIDTPSRADVLLPAGLLVCAGALAFSSPSLSLAFGVCCSVYFISRKENKLGRAFLLTLAGLVIGVLLGVQIGSLIVPQLASLQLDPNAFAALVTSFLFWLISSFLR